MIPRRPSVIAGTLPSKKPESLMIAASALSRSRLSASQRSRCAELDSSSPSNRYLTLTGKRPAVARIAAAAITWAWIWPLSSAAPRASIRSSTTTGSNGGDVHSSSGIDRLDVVVAVDDHGRRIGRVEPVRVDDGMAAGLERLGVLDAGRCQRVDQPLGRTPAVGRRAQGCRRCSGCAGSPCTTRCVRRASPRGGRQGRRRRRRRAPPWSGRRACQSCPRL